MSERLRDRLGVGHLLAGTTALTGLLIVLGVYTAASGAGLACQQQWPLCDGGLLPQTIPSFIEWAHRFVAMITGFVIIGAAAATWRYGSERRTRLAATAAVALLPLQVILGGATVTIEGAIPWGYSPSVHALHLGAALSIFSALTLATLWSFDGRLPTGRTRGALVGALGALLAGLPFAREIGLQYTTGVQTVYYALCLTCFAALLTAAVWAREEGWPAATRRLALAALPLVVFQLVVARSIVGFFGVVPAAYLASVVGTVALIAAGLWTLRRGAADGDATGRTVRGD
jgi:cytochrome c oxidase assembly protein subunit 15